MTALAFASTWRRNLLRGCGTPTERRTGDATRLRRACGGPPLLSRHEAQRHADVAHERPSPVLRPASLERTDGAPCHEAGSWWARVTRSSSPRLGGQTLRVASCCVGVREPVHFVPLAGSGGGGGQEPARTLPDERGPTEAPAGRNAGTDRSPTVGRSWRREFQKASACRGPEGSHGKAWERRLLPHRRMLQGIVHSRKNRKSQHSIVLGSWRCR